MDNVLITDSFNPVFCAFNTPNGLPLITIYRRPKDMPEQEYVARMWIVKKNGQRVATAYVAVANTLKEIRKYIPSGCVCFSRSPEDEPHIVECWV